MSLRYLHRNSHTDTTTVRFRTVPNCVAKVKGEHDSRIGATVLECTDLAALTVKRPIERGYLVNTQQQRDIWMHTLTQVIGGWVRAHAHYLASCMARCMTPTLMNVEQQCS